MLRFRRKKRDDRAPESEAGQSPEAAIEDAVGADDTSARRAGDPAPLPTADPEPLPEPEAGAEAAPDPEAAEVEADEEVVAAGDAEAVPVDAAAAEKSGGLFGRLRTGLARSRSAFAEGIGNLILGEKEVDEVLLEDLETQLLVADVGVDASTEIVEGLAARVQRRQLNDSRALLGALHDDLTDLLASRHVPFELPAEPRPFVILVVGVNGVGKTTTIGKLARRFKDAGHVPILAAGDTFRAAAVEQLQRWGERNDVEVVAQGEGADTASVIFDALSAAKARGADVVLADTAGRLHNKTGLMEELAKVGRVMKRFDATAPHAVLLVLDAATGQNALVQAREFGQAVDLTGIVLTKLDGTAKGGIAFAIARQTGLPIQFIGIGESVEDLRPFEPEAFVAALLEGAGG
ncbi:MAG: signal recognition particle-docking protein FtsY [Pseudomonadales bacterium]|jgi:fused signal recognition particle receptor|nr:signal recognition particle-docking protein FtsY [Pseudomonadales bacterium]